MGTFERTTEQTALVGRWVAWIFGGLMVLMVLTIFIGESLQSGFHGLTQLTTRDKITLLGCSDSGTDYR